jgi:hypothetical protein
MITDFAITATAWWGSWLLLMRAGNRRYRCRRLWAVGLFFVGLGALLGGVRHGLPVYLSDAANLAVWKGTVYTIGLSLVFVVAGTIAGSPLQASTGKLFRAVNIFVFVLFALWMVRHNDFLYVIYYYVPAILTVAAIHGWAHVKHKSDGAVWIMSGVIVTLLGAVAQQSGLALHKHFNHNDLFHVIQVAGLIMFFKGASNLTDHCIDHDM